MTKPAERPTECCPKCGATEWDGPRFVPSEFVPNVGTFAEQLRWTCRCGWNRYTPTIDANRPADV